MQLVYLVMGPSWPGINTPSQLLRRPLPLSNLLLHGMPASSVSVMDCIARRWAACIFRRIGDGLHSGRGSARRPCGLLPPTRHLDAAPASVVVRRRWIGPYGWGGSGPGRRSAVPSVVGEAPRCRWRGGTEVSRSFLRQSTGRRKNDT